MRIPVSLIGIGRQGEVGGEEREFSRQWEEHDPIPRGKREDSESGELRITEYGCDARTLHK